MGKTLTEKLIAAHLVSGTMEQGGGNRPAD